jgi:hypothetical protein
VYQAYFAAAGHFPGNNCDIILATAIFNEIKG